MIYCKVRKTVILNTFILLIIACTSKDDPYKKIFRNTTVSREVFKKSFQIIKNESDVILLVDLSVHWELVDTHILFLDSTYKLSSICFLPAVKIDSIVNNEIFAIKNEGKLSRQSNYHCDIPRNYKIILKVDQNTHKVRVANKIVEKIVVKENGDLIEFSIKNRFSSDKGTHTSQVIKLELSKLYFEYNKSLISFFYIDNKGQLVRDVMEVKSKALYDQFYSDLFKHLSYHK